MRKFRLFLLAILLLALPANNAFSAATDLNATATIRANLSVAQTQAIQYFTLAKATASTACTRFTIGPDTIPSNSLTALQNGVGICNTSTTLGDGFYVDTGQLHGRVTVTGDDAQAITLTVGTPACSGASGPTLTVTTLPAVGTIGTTSGTEIIEVSSFLDVPGGTGTVGSTFSCTIAFTVVY